MNGPADGRRRRLRLILPGSFKGVQHGLPGGGEPGRVAGDETALLQLGAMLLAAYLDRPEGSADGGTA
jgi:hypothetical protein